VSRIVVQDDVREKLMIDMGGLLPVTGRLGADAQDHLGNLFELKSTSKSSVSTARDFHQDTINKYRERYWLVATFDAGRMDFENLYFLAPQHLEEWYRSQETILSRYSRICDRMFEVIASHDFDHHEVSMLKGIATRGSKRNDPNIPMTYIRKNGKKLNLDENVPAQIASLVSQYTIVKTLHNEDDMFVFNIF